jgi:hypothetical protein
MNIFKSRFEKERLISLNARLSSLERLISAVSSQRPLKENLLLQLQILKNDIEKHGLNTSILSHWTTSLEDKILNLPTDTKLWDTINYRLVDALCSASRVEVFAQTIDFNGELPVFAYGIRTYTKDNNPTTFVFDSGADGFTLSDIADERRSASINAVIFYLHRLLIDMVLPFEVVVITSIPISGILTPRNFFPTNLSTERGNC